MFKGEPVENPPESLRLFILASGMEFNHLPVYGGLYDQDPRLLDQWDLIFRVQSEYERRRQDQEKRKSRTGRR